MNDIKSLSHSKWNCNYHNTLPKEQRAANMLAVMKNPYCFRHGDMVIKLEFADDGPPLQDLLTSFFLRMKSGL